MPIWFLYNVTSEVESGASTFEEIAHIIKVTPRQEVMDILIWQEGYPDWKSILTVHEFTEVLDHAHGIGALKKAPPVRKIPAEPIEPAEPKPHGPPVMPHVTELVAEQNNLVFQLPLQPENSNENSTDESWNERRKDPRFDIKFKIIITNLKNTFVSYSADISAGGAKLVDLIPPHLFSQESQVFIQAPGGRECIKFKCHSIGVDQQTNRIQFENQDDPDRKEKLNQWINWHSGKMVKAG